MNEIDRGSEWRKWDLHIHTPGTKKNDQFSGSTLDEKWLNYAESINNAPEEISVIGITDYFSIENYFRFKKLVADGTITKKFDLIIPNIELRVTPVTSSSTPINIHCLFNPSIDEEIATRFLAKLQFASGNHTYSAIKNELVRFGRNHNGNQSLDEETAYKKGIEQFVISLDTLMNVFKNDSALRENTLIVVSNKSTDGVSGITKHEDFFINKSVSQLDATRQSFYKFSDAIFSSNQSDRNYFIGKGADNETDVIRKCGSLKPCYHGCDAHANSDIFKPAENRYCWIKADPTFEGLKQTLYEPEDRVKIQELKPDFKNDRFVISELEFIDSGDLFGNQVIPLNDNLNAIIGGKSSGKSLLLFSIAQSIDPEQVEKTSQRLKFDGYKFDTTFNFKVTWKNGEVDLYSKNSDKPHKISYIPQLYINHLVEKNNKDELNLLIKNILLQDASFKQFDENIFNAIAEVTSEIDRLLNEYIKVRNNILDIQQKIKDNGNSEAIHQAIDSIKAHVQKAQATSNLTETEREHYNNLIDTKLSLEKELNRLGAKETVLKKVLHELSQSKQYLFGKKDSNSASLKGSVDKILDELGTIGSDIDAIRQSLCEKYNVLISDFENQISALNLEDYKSKIQEKIRENATNLDPYMQKMAGQHEIQKLTKQLEGEDGKYQLVVKLEEQRKRLLNEYENIRTETTNLLNKRWGLYKEITQKVNDTQHNIGAEIKLNCNLIYKQENLILFNQVNKAALSSDHDFNRLFTDGLVNYDKLITLYNKQLRVKDDKLFSTKDDSTPLRTRITLEDVLRGLVKDYFEIDYTVTYKGDDLLYMSPGKKGTVLLILFLQISSSEFPILIDQPEDNLDNRTIYELLCKMIKEKKKDRQILIVSHNANLVVATDAENIIVANQKGQSDEDSDGGYRFEYINGSLENTKSETASSTSTLMGQGIRHHVCDILEGGDVAFKQREKKYAIKYDV